MLSRCARLPLTTASLGLTLLLASCGPGGDPSFAVAINEVQAVGSDWVELYNASGASVDLSGYSITDGAGAPRRGVATVFPEGTLLGAGEYLLIVANRGADAMPGVQTMCLLDGPPTCFHASWGVNRTDGEFVYLLAPDGSVVVEEFYPPEPVTIGQAYGRLPDGSGAFTATQPSPGAPNRSPL